MERSVNLYAGLLALTIVAWAVHFLTRRERLPNVEFIRIAAKPGRAGDSDDVEAFMKDSLGAIMKGYTQYSKHGKHFLLRTPTQVYLMASSSMLDEIRKAPESQLSQPAAANIIFQIKHTFHPGLLNDYYHFDVVRKSLTQNLPRIIGDLAAETRFALGRELGNSKGWQQSQVFHTATQMVTRISNRMMVGLELCRNEEYLLYSATYTKATFDAAAMLRNVPGPLKSLVMYFNTSHKSQQQIARKLMFPIIKQRLCKARSEFAKSEHRPNDALQWLLDITPPEKRDPELLLQRMIHINVTAIHATAVTLTECIFDLCRHPEIHAELRHEISEVLGNKSLSDAWTKVNVDRLVKLDSFIRESARLTPMSAG
ncbi:hypothetical protein FDECE_15978 [Fusarium decemcellulare]|nr:hypothetical protein FDECE_15978 [Fusarium decemcellulare]